MDQRLDVSLNVTEKPSKLLALIALVVACALPFILVKLFPHKQKNTYSPKSSVISSVPLVPEFNSPDYADPRMSEDISLPNPRARTTTNPPKHEVAVKNTFPTTKPNSEWKIIKTKDKDSLANVFNRAGLSAKTLQNILRDNPHTAALTRLKPNQDIQLLIKNQTLEKMILPYTITQYLVIYKEKEHYKSKINTRKMNSHSHFLTATVQGSLYTTAKKYNIPSKLIRQMTEIFTWDINFSKDIKAGDQFSIVYKAYYIENKLVGTGDILAVTYKNRGKVFQAIRHTNRAGYSDYYSPQGVSLKKAFNRYPVRFSHISSTFSLSRYHPILHYRRAHKGIDLAAHIGTPIQATGDGRITLIGRQNGYGNMIKINHNKNYSTIYGHMLKFQKGLSRGDFVKRGQVIGYVGQSGLASGPHCHYEFHINNQPKNPATIDLPRGIPLSGHEFANFKQSSATLLAQLKLFENSKLASSGKGSEHRDA